MVFSLNVSFDSVFVISFTEITTSSFVEVVILNDVSLLFGDNFLEFVFLILRIVQVFLHLLELAGQTFKLLLVRLSHLVQFVLEHLLSILHSFPFGLLHLDFERLLGRFQDVFELLLLSFQGINLALVNLRGLWWRRRLRRLAFIEELLCGIDIIGCLLSDSVWVRWRLV